MVPVTWAATSATVQPSHRVGAAQSLASSDRSSSSKLAYSAMVPSSTSSRGRTMGILHFHTDCTYLIADVQSVCQWTERVTVATAPAFGPGRIGCAWIYGHDVRASLPRVV